MNSRRWVLLLPSLFSSSRAFLLPRRGRSRATHFETRSAKPIKVSDWAQTVEKGTVIKDGVVKPPSISPGEESNVEKITPSRMEIFVKAGPEGNDIGDCPFAQYDRMVMFAKDLSFTTTPCTAESKPSWLIDSYEGKMPCLLHDGEARVESNDIALYINFFFPSPPLSSHSDETDAAVAGLFPAIANFLKNTDDAADAKLRSVLEDALSNLEVHLARVAPGNAEGSAPFMAGGDMLGLADCALAPKLYHLDIAAAHFKDPPFVVDKNYPIVRKYMDIMFAHPAFVSSAVPASTVLWGWGNARK